MFCCIVASQVLFLSLFEIVPSSAMAKVILSFALVACVQAQSNLTAGVSGTLYIVRHGEKGSDGCENSKGMKRANNMYDVFRSKFQVPGYVYAYHYSSQCERAEQTATPIAKKIGMSGPDKHYGHHECSSSGCSKFANAITSRLSKTSVVLAVLEHQKPKNLAEALGVHSSELPHWSYSDFDSVWELKFSGGKPSFSHHHQVGGTSEDEVVV